MVSRPCSFILEICVRKAIAGVLWGGTQTVSVCASRYYVLMIREDSGMEKKDGISLRVEAKKMIT